MARRKIIGVMGGAEATPEVEALAEELGRRIAEAGFTLLTGGRPAGVMEAASRGAKQAQGLVVGILPGPDPDEASKFVDIAIATNLQDARNLANVLSCDVVVACPGGAGTLTEVGMALKNRKPLVLLRFDPGPVKNSAIREGIAVCVKTPAEAMAAVQDFLAKEKK
ncbi:MAG: TIGR00725 family protein [Myxococcales bacterium]|nr:TIGR00725 family protein [Myxococcales bacterium]